MDWEKKFDEQFEGVEFGVTAESIKSFIRTEIEQARQEGWEEQKKEDLARTKIGLSSLLGEVTTQARQQEQARIEKIIEEMVGNDKVPWQSLQFQGCPECGMDVNREWVDNKCKEIYNTALDSLKSRLKGEKE